VNLGVLALAAAVAVPMVAAGGLIAVGVGPSATFWLEAAVLTAAIGLAAMFPTLLRPIHAQGALMSMLCGFGIRFLGLLVAYLLTRATDGAPQSMLPFCAACLVLVTFIDAGAFLYRAFHPKEPVSV
jgi:hypothetical protein